MPLPPNPVTPNGPATPPRPDAPRRSSSPSRNWIAVAALSGVVLGGALGASAIATTRPVAVMAPAVPVAIQALRPNRISTIHGTVSDRFGQDLVLSDATGRALVDLGPSPIPAGHAGEALSVQGRLERGVFRAAFVVTPNGDVQAVGPLAGPPPPPPGAGPGAPPPPPPGGPAGAPPPPPPGGPGAPVPPPPGGPGVPGQPGPGPVAPGAAGPGFAGPGPVPPGAAGPGAAAPGAGAPVPPPPGGPGATAPGAVPPPPAPGGAPAPVNNPPASAV